MEYLALFIWLGAGGICIAMGLLIWKKQKIALIHSYHYKRVTASNLGPYTKRMGQGTVVIGVSAIAAGLINLVTNTQYGLVAFAIGFLVGFGTILRTQKKYNGGLF